MCIVLLLFNRLAGLPGKGSGSWKVPNYADWCSMNIRLARKRSICGTVCQTEQCFATVWSLVRRSMRNSRLPDSHLNRQTSKRHNCEFPINWCKNARNLQNRKFRFLKWSSTKIICSPIKEFHQNFRLRLFKTGMHPSASIMSASSLLSSLTSLWHYGVYSNLEFPGIRICQVRVWTDESVRTDALLL